jgi:hypothetical protein
MIKLSPSAYVAAAQVETIIVDASGKHPEIVVLTLTGKEFRVPMVDQAAAELKALELAQAIVATNA